MKFSLKNDWRDILAGEFQKPYFQALEAFIAEEEAHYRVYPPQTQRFRSLELTPCHRVKVLILGQDPYHQAHQANGLAFSVPQGVKLPPSLRNIFKELRDDLGGELSTTGDLSPWATQGVLLLNTVLTVRDNAANSHKGRGWETFTDAIIQALNHRKDPVVFILWGSQAAKKLSMIDQKRHPVITAPHPSPLSSYRGFFGSKPFSTANDHLERQGKEPIHWLIKN
ncbi:MAG: uracil-DNA glycosylase [delta proteobacterium ML8_F1]|nr:MAG: uracil-DNA glycosylase [delta proteobacterium ML8_F1]